MAPFGHVLSAINFRYTSWPGTLKWINIESAGGANAGRYHGTIVDFLPLEKSILDLFFSIVSNPFQDVHPGTSKVATRSLLELRKFHVP